MAMDKNQSSKMVRRSFCVAGDVVSVVEIRLHISADISGGREMGDSGPAGLLSIERIQMVRQWERG